MIESPSEEEEDEKEYEEEMTLFIKKFNKFISKRRPFEGDRKEKPRSKRAYCNYGKSGHFIVQCYERKEEDDDKKKKLTRATRKTRN
jgi:hypothetical protein